jgi:sugar phosphate isomerase/epimerase
MTTRRKFLQSAGKLALAMPLAGSYMNVFADAGNKKKIELDAHLWVYASRFPPTWDCTPILDEAFSDIKYAGFHGIELMESIIRHEGSVRRLKELSDKYSLPVVGTSYNADMWVKDHKQKILEDAEMVIEKLHSAGGTILGITTGDADRIKTDEELDAQADLLKQLMVICKKNKIVPNLHNHTFEVASNLHDFKGTIERVPEIKLGPDLNWLIRGGVDPVWFIKTYGHKMVYMHIRDQDANGKWTEAVGEGVTDFPAIARALQEISYNGKAAVELAFEGQPVKPVRQSWKTSRDYVNKIFGW